MKTLVQHLDTYRNPDENRRMHKMVGPLLLLASLIIPSALQQQAETVEEKLEVISDWLVDWKTLSSDTQVLITRNQVLITENQDDLQDTLNKVVAEATEVKAQNEQLLVDLADLVKTVQGTQNVTSQLLVDLHVLKGRQAVAGTIQGAQVFMFLAYLSTLFVFYLVKHCKKHHKKVAREEFELLESKLQASRSKRRAAAAKAAKQSPQ